MPWDNYPDSKLSRLAHIHTYLTTTTTKKTAQEPVCRGNEWNLNKERKVT